MRSRALRWTLTLLVITATGVAGYYAWTLQQQVDAAEAAASAAADANLSAARAAFDLRSAQQAYVAAGQNKDFWFEKATAATAAIRSSLESLEQITTSDAARTALAESSKYLDEFAQQDRRVRGYASSGQELLASDIIFSDGRDSITRLLAALDLAADADRRDRASTISRIRREQMLVAGGVIALAVLMLLILAPLPASIAGDVAKSAEPEKRQATLDLDLRPTPRYVVTQPAAPRPAAPPARPAPPPSEKAQDEPKPAPVPEPAPPPRLRLDELARVCSDLARLSDSSSIPGILERTAMALEASGLVLWVADAQGQVLTPIAAHGYPANVLSRMGTIRVDDENVTATAFRTGLVQSVKADGSTSGAIAAPLVAPGGPLGVIAAEIRAGSDENDRLAAAAIVAAQLATLVGVPAAEGSDTANYELRTTN